MLPRERRKDMTVRTGLDVLVDDGMAKLKGEKVAILGNPASVDRTFTHLLDRCLEHEVDLVRLFGPEHGLLGDAQDMADVDGHKDARTGLEVVSLYGQTRDSLFLRPEQLEGVTTLVCDLQDIGSRYYTFSYTIAFAMRACAAAGVKCLVLDRPNPIGATLVEGNEVLPAFGSFVGEYPLANRHGMTMGELCQFFKQQDEDAAGCELEVVWMRGYNPSMLMRETGAPWVMPSPNMPTPETALVYPGQCIFEGTNMSEGRGTTRPFELVGAPYLESYAFAERALEQGVPGVQLRPCWFTPTFQKHAKALCGGVQLHVSDAEAFRPVRTAVALLRSAMSFDGFGWREEVYEFVSDRNPVDLLFGDDKPRKMLEGGASVDEVMAFLDEAAPSVAARRDPALHYPRG
jgi:uncharacterized protein YbbC (DUF1343 family)